MDKEKKPTTASNLFTVKKMIEKISCLKGATAATSIEHTSIRPTQSPDDRRVQNFLLIWLDNSIDEVNSDECRDTITKLRQVVNTVRTFTDADECINFITGLKDETVSIIFSGSLGQRTVPIIHHMPQVNSIYIFCGNKAKHEQWAKEWPKIKGVFTEITSICKALKDVVQEGDENNISMSFIQASDGAKNQNVDQLDQSFVYIQVVKEILLSINFEQRHFMEFIAYCRKQFANNIFELKNIDKLEREYHCHQPIWWYTRYYFLYSMVNRALRTMEVDIIMKMGFFVRDLHEHIAQLHSEQYAGHHHSVSFTVHRGQGLSQTDFDQLMKTKNGLLSFNNFLSTSKDYSIPLQFARQTIANSDLMGVLFVMTINPSILFTPFANVRNVSYYHTEEEVLFSMHSVFRIDQIKQIDNNNRLWQVKLTLTSDKDPQLYALIDRINLETFSNKKGWYRLGYLLIKLGQFSKAQRVGEIMLDQISDACEKPNIYYMLGMVKDSEGKYDEAITFYENSIEIMKMILPSNPSDLAVSYDSIGVVYEKIGKYSKALASYEKAFEIKQKTLPPSHPDLTVSYNNIGSVYNEMGEYSKALASYEKALEIRQKTLPSNHPDLAVCFSYIGVVYDKMGEYSKALSFHERALDIGQLSLPPDHPRLQLYQTRVEIERKNVNESRL